MLKFHYTKTLKKFVIYLLTSLFRRSEIVRLKKNYLLFVEILEHCINKHKKNQEDKFIEAYLLLGNKLLVDVQSAKLLCYLGLYGSAHALLAVILRSVRMIGSLFLKPKLIDEYLDEKKTSDVDNDFMRKFSEGSLRKILDERFGKYERGEYANIEKSLHGSSVGTKIYYARIRHNPNGTKGGDIIYNAFFEDEKSGAVLNILNGALLDACGVYLEKYESDKTLSDIRKNYDYQIKLELKDLLKSSLKMSIKESLEK